jgi:RNA polymerase sigma-54 factor
MATPQGIFEMKYFFTSGYQTATGESLNNTSVKQAILDLVKHENGSAPLSDHEIVEILGERGIRIARRTVAKYPHRAKYSTKPHAAEILADRGKL